MKITVFIFLFVLSNLFCFADIAISSKSYNKEKFSIKESVQQLAPDNNIKTELNNSPTIIIKLLKLIWLIIMLLVATILPPLAVLLYFGAHRKFWVCLLLTILGFVPGIIYAWFQKAEEPGNKGRFRFSPQRHREHRDFFAANVHLLKASQ